MPRQKRREEDNDFGEQTYWNQQPTARRTQRLVSKYPSIKAKSIKTAKETKEKLKLQSPPRQATLKSPSRSPSPTNSLSQTSKFYNTSFNHSTLKNANYLTREEEKDAKDEKSIMKLMKSSLPNFSNETDWETSIFELGLILDRVWPHKDDLDIMQYMTNPSYHSHTDMRNRADRLIYFALTTAAKKDSYAKLQIIAASNRDSVPCVMPNEGKKLYQMFQALFTMTNLHKASLPTVMAEFYNITQKENESILQYTSRVDIIVSTLAKLGEQVSPGVWIYALGNGLLPKYTDSKAGILYNKEGFDTVLSVKKKLQSEEAVLKGVNKLASGHLKIVPEKEDEIALNLQDNGAPSTAIPESDTKDKALYFKGKGKGNQKGKGKNKSKSRWTDQQPN